MWAAVALAASVVTTDRARAEIAFTAPQVVDPVDATTPQIGVDSEGRATIVWMDYDPETEGTKVKAQRLSPSGVPEPVQTLALVAKALPQCVCPKVAVAPGGGATVVWQGVTSEGRQIEAAHLGADGLAGPSQVISPPGLEAWYQIPTANQVGESVVVWQSAGPEGKVESVILDAAGVPGEVHPLSPPGEGRHPVPAASPTGSFHVAWTESDGIHATKLDGEGAPGEIKPISPPGEQAGAADIVVDAEGRATVSWWRGFGPNEAKAVRLAADGTPGTVLTLSPPGQEVYEPRLAIDPQGRVTAVWQSFADEVFALRIDAEANPGPVQQLSPKGEPVGEPQVAAAADGRVVVTWAHASSPYTPEPECLDQEFDPEADVVRAAFIGADGQLGQILDASPHGQQSLAANLALDPQGLPWVTWNSFDGSYFCEQWEPRIQVSHAVTRPPEEEEEEDPPPPPVPPTPEAAPSPPTLRLAKKGRAHEGRVILRARCQGAAGTVCSGRFRLKASVASLRPQSAARARHKPASLVLARGGYRVPGGKGKTIALPVAAAVRGLLKEAGSSWISVSARGRGLVPSSLLIRLPGGPT